MSDKTLVKRFLEERDEKSFSQLYDSKTPRLYRIALRLVANNEWEAQDLVQEMWIIAVRKLDLFRWESELKTWLVSILINLARAKRKKEEVVASLEIAEKEIEPLPDPDFSREELENAIAALPPGYRQIIILHDIEGYKHEEIAVIMDISAGTSKSQLHHARKALKQYLVGKIT